jgi:hypothetical protein
MGSAAMISEPEAGALSPSPAAALPTEARSISKWVRLLPLGFFLAYLHLTVFLFAFGPWPYPMEDATSLWVFLGSVHLALLLGYLSGAFGKPHGYAGPWGARGLVAWCAVVNLALLPPTSLFRTGSLLPDVLGGLTNPGDKYAESVLLRSEGTPLIEYVRLFFGPFFAWLLPLTVFYWRSLGPLLRVLAVASILGVVALFIGMGTNKAIADVILLAPWLLLAGHLSGRLRLSRAALTALGGAALVAFGMFLAFFAATQSTRQGSMAHWGYLPPLDLYADGDHWTVRHLNDEARTGVYGLALYLGSGYYGLYMSMEEEFEPGLGFGHSPFLSRQAARVTGDNRWLDVPYPVRIESRGWSSILWATAYAWMASDVHWVGVVVLVFLIGRCFALSWLDTLQGSNPFAVAIFAQFVMMIYYLPANNQCMQEAEGLTAFWVSLVLWLLTRGRATG